MRYIPIEMYKHFSISLDCNGKTSREVEEYIYNKSKEIVDNTLVTIRLFGFLSEGNPSDISYKDIYKNMYSKGAFVILKNTIKLNSSEVDSSLITIQPAEEIENEIISIYEDNTPVLLKNNNYSLSDMIKRLSSEKMEGERVIDFEKRIKKEIFYLFFANED
jgi:hypothetical protein